MNIDLFNNIVSNKNTKDRFTNNREYKKRLNNQFNNLKSVMNYRDLNQLHKYLRDRSKKIKKQATMTHY